MLVCEFRGQKIVFIKIRTSADREEALAEVRKGGMTKIVVCLDMGVSSEFQVFILANTEDGRRVIVRDHSDIHGEPRGFEDMERRAAVQRVRQLATEARIGNHTDHPACSMLVTRGEFVNTTGGTVIMADPDADGLMAALKAVGYDYDGMDNDVRVMSGPRENRTARCMTPRAWALYRKLSEAPKFNPARPNDRTRHKESAISEFIRTLS